VCTIRVWEAQPRRSSTRPAHSPLAEPPSSPATAPAQHVPIDEFVNVEIASPHVRLPSQGPATTRQWGSIVLTLLVAGVVLEGLIYISPQVRAYTPHVPIFIDGNAEFTPANGVTGGSGTSLDPYRIDGWEINASGVPAVAVRNTDAFFTILNVLLQVSGSDVGVLLINVSHGRIQAIQIDAEGYGVQTWLSSDIVITGSTFNATSRASVTLSQTSGANLAGNNLGSGGLTVDGTNRSHFSSHTISGDNLVNGKPFLYSSNCNGANIDGVVAGQLLVANCTNARVSNLTISNTTRAVHLAYVDGAVLDGNALVANSEAAIRIESSTNVAVTDNQLWDNLYGAYVVLSTQVSLDGNEVLRNRGLVPGDTGRGLYIASSTATVSNNTVSDNDFGILMGSSSNSTIRNNTVSGNMRSGIAVGGTTAITILNNTVSDNWENGIDIGYSVDIHALNNTLVADGIVLRGAEVGEFDSHTITGNTVNGLPVLYLKDCASVSLDAIPVGQVIAADCQDLRLANLVLSNTDMGIELAFVQRADTAQVNITGNRGWGMYLRSSSNVTLRGSRLSGNEGIGIHIEYSYQINVTGSTVVGSNYGIFASGSSRLRVDSNAISNNSWYGADFIGGVNLVFARNAVVSNARSGFLCGGCQNFTAHGNEVRSSSYAGMDVRFSSGLIVSNNVSGNPGTGILLAASNSVAVHHNNLLGNGRNAEDWSSAIWDDGYPSGGNFWGDYGGADRCTGPSQDVCPSPDALGDSPHVLDVDSQDRYPLAEPLSSILPAPPRIARAYLSGAGLRNLTLEWTRSPDEALPYRQVAYEVLRSPALSGPFGSIASVSANGSALYQHTCVDCGHILGDVNHTFFQVRARDGPAYSDSNLAARYSRAVAAGRNVLSVPLAQPDANPPYVLQTLGIGTVHAFVASDGADPWKSFHPGRSGDLSGLGFGDGFWVETTIDGQYTLAGLLVARPTLFLRSGWNLVSYASFVPRAWEASLAGIPGVRLEALGAPGADPYGLRAVAPAEILVPGEAYWIHNLGASAVWMP